LGNVLHVYECLECKRQSLIAQGYCFTCRKKDSYRPVDVEGKGTIFSFTRIYVAEERLQEETPYVVAVIECEGGLRLMARIKHQDSDLVSIGSTVDLVEWKENVPIFKLS